MVLQIDKKKGICGKELVMEGKNMEVMLLSWGWFFNFLGLGE